MKKWMFIIVIAVALSFSGCADTADAENSSMATTSSESNNDSTTTSSSETIWVAIADASISERDGSTTATVTRIDPSGDLTINLTSSDTTEATVVDFVVIADGSTVSPTFTIAAVDDLIVDGTIIVTITASASAYEDGITTIDVLDHGRVARAQSCRPRWFCRAPLHLL